MNPIILSYANKLKKYSQTLGKTNVFVEKPWTMIDGDLSIQRLIFKANGELIESRNGNAEIGKWEYLLEANSLLIKRKNGNILCNDIYNDNAVMILQLDSLAAPYFVLANPNVLPNLDVAGYLHKKMYKELNLMERKLEDGRIITIKKSDRHQENIRIGNEVFFDDKLIVNAQLKLKNNNKILVVKNGVVTRFITLVSYILVDDTRMYIYQKDPLTISEGDEVIFKEGKARDILEITNKTKLHISNGKITKIEKEPVSKMPIIVIAFILVFLFIIYLGYQYLHKSRESEPIIENFEDDTRLTPAETITKDFINFMDFRIGNRKLKTNVIFGDLNGDGVDDAVVDYCIEGTDEDRDVGGGNALMSLECMESGFAVYVKSGNSFYLKKDRDKSYFADEGSEYKAERIQNGKIFCTNDSYEDDDPRCCPSQKGSIYLVYENGELIKPAQIRLITTNESTDVRIEREVNLPEKINSYQDLEKIGFVILGQVAKDFNYDDWADRVIIIDKKNNEKDSRRILVYCSDGSPQCKLQTNNNKLILGEGDGGMISDPFSSIALNNNGDLEIKFEPDVNYRYTYTYRYLGEYKLIGFTDYWFSRTTINHESVEKSINFLTGKTNIKSDPGNGDTPEENWHSFDTQYNQFTLREQQKPWSYEINGIEF